MLKIGNIEFDKHPLFLAPMEDVTDKSFRILCKEFGADMLYTEFVNSDGLIRNVNKSLKKIEIQNRNIEYLPITISESLSIIEMKDIYKKYGIEYLVNSPTLFNLLNSKNY